MPEFVPSCSTGGVDVKLTYQTAARTPHLGGEAGLYAPDFCTT